MKTNTIIGRSVKLAHPVDIQVGQRIREQRRRSGMRQVDLAEALDINFQQIQKYETGTNRVSASKLWSISEKLNVPISYFFDGLEGKSIPTHHPGRDELKLLRIFASLTEIQKQQFMKIAQIFAKEY